MFSFSTFSRLKSYFSYRETQDGTVLSCKKMDNSEYDDIKYIVESCGGHWQEGFFFPMFCSEVREKIESVTESSVAEHVTQRQFQIDNQFYRTPAWLAEKMVALARIDELRNARILEPSAEMA